MMESEANEHWSKTEQQGWTKGMRRMGPEEALNQRNKDGQSLIKEIEKEENDKQSLRMPSPEEMKEIEKKEEQSLKVTGKKGRD